VIEAGRLGIVTAMNLRALLACALLSCSGSSAEPTELSLHLRPNVRQAFELPKEDYSGATPGSFSLASFAVWDVAREGDTVLVSLSIGRPGIPVWHPGDTPDDPMTVGTAQSTSVGVVLLRSDDRGETWSALHLTEPPHSLGMGLRGVHSWQGKAVAVGFEREEHPLGVEETYPAEPLDLATRAWSPNATLAMTPFQASPRGSGGMLRSFKVHSVSGGSLVPVLQTYDFATGTMAQPEVQGEAPCTDFLWNTDGSAASAACTRPETHCQATLTGTKLTSHCLSLSAIPASLLGLTPGVATTGDGRALSVFSDGTHAWGLYFEGSAPLKMPLGKGSYRDDNGRVHHAWSGLLHLGGDGVERLVDLTVPSNPVEVRLPATACEGSEACGTRVWTLALGEDEYLSFYAVDSATKGGVERSHMHLYVSRDRAERVPLQDAAPWPGGDAVLSKYPSATPAGPLQAQCIAAQRCWPAHAWLDCVNEWSHTPFGNPALAKFLAASPTDCEALGAANPKQTLTGTSPCAPGCQGDVLIPFCQYPTGSPPDPSYGKVVQVIDCAVYGSHCYDPKDGTGPSCLDGSEMGADGCTASGSAVRTDQGPRIDWHCPSFGSQTCGRHPGFSEAVCSAPCDQGSRCEGSSAIACVPDSPGEKNDCSLFGQTCQLHTVAPGSDCDPSNPACQPRSSCESPPGNEALDPHCEGSLLLFRYGNVRYFDCAALGASCSDSTLPPRCL